MTNNKIDAIGVKYGGTIDVPKDNFMPLHNELQHPLQSIFSCHQFINYNELRKRQSVMTSINLVFI
jgi:hypothetical protein